MSSARFTRGRLRICVLLGMFLVLIMMIVVYHMSQHQLDESRAFNVRCEHSLTEQKSAAEKKLDDVLTGQQQKHDVRLADVEHKHQESLRAMSEKYEAQVEKYARLEEDFVRSKKEHLKDTNAFEKKMQTLLADLQKDKVAKEREVTEWKDKFDKLQRDSQRNSAALETIIAEYRKNCEYMPRKQAGELSQQLNKPASHTSETTRNSSPAHLAVHSIEKPRNGKNFDAQEQVSPGVYRIGGGIVPKSLKTPTNEQQEGPPAVAVAGAVASPLSAPRRPSSTEHSPGASVAPKAQMSSSSGLPPLAVPPPKPAERKLPENVAPIPDNFGDGKGEGADQDTAAEELPKNESNKNNRYANIVQDMEPNKVPKANEDSGAHEVKDILNEANFNLPAAAAEKHFFDGEAGAAAGAGGEAEAANKDGAGAAEVGGDDDDDIMGNVADVAVKQPQNLLDAENLNNEIAGDQGKEFPEGLHLDEGLEEDQDEDDYSNLAARKQGAEAIRN